MRPFRANLYTPMGNGRPGSARTRRRDVDADQGHHDQNQQGGTHSKGPPSPGAVRTGGGFLLFHPDHPWDLEQELQRQAQQEQWQQQRQVRARVCVCARDRGSPRSMADSTAEVTFTSTCGTLALVGGGTGGVLYADEASLQLPWYDGRVLSMFSRSLQMD